MLTAKKCISQKGWCAMNKMDVLRLAVCFADEVFVWVTCCTPVCAHELPTKGQCFPFGVSHQRSANRQGMPIISIKTIVPIS